MLEQIAIACFIGTWIILAIVGYVLFYVSRNVAFKRKWLPRYVVLVGILFIIFSATITALSSSQREMWWMLVAMIPVISLISVMDIKMTKFCDNCGATLTPQVGFASMKFCPKCGAAFEISPRR